MPQKKAAKTKDPSPTTRGDESNDTILELKQKIKKQGQLLEQQHEELMQPVRDDRAWRVAQIAATLATRHPGSSSSKTDGISFTSGQDSYSLPECDSDLDDFYLALISRANFILEHSRRQFNSDYFQAYSLFIPGKLYSMDQTVQHFKKAKWRGLTSDKSVKRLIDDTVEAHKEALKEAKQILRKKPKNQYQKLNVEWLSGSLTRLDEHRRKEGEAVGRGYLKWST